MTRRATVLGASLVLEHVPDLVRYGSKPTREPGKHDALASALRSFDEAVRTRRTRSSSATWPHGSCGTSNALGGVTLATTPSAAGSFGEVMDQAAFYELMAEVDQFDLVRLKQEPGPGELPLFSGVDVVGAVAPAHDVDETLQAPILLENLTIKASAVHALRDLLARTGVDPSTISLAIGCGEEAIGDRYQRGGGNLARAVAEQCGLEEAGGFDVKSFCSAPVHALVVAAAMIEAGIDGSVVIVAGGSLAKLGMKFEGAIAKGVPILEDVLAGLAILLTSSDEADGPVIRSDAVGRITAATGGTPQAQLEGLVGRPLDALGIGVTDVDVYATELHNPEITEPQGGGDVPDRNYRMVAGLGVLRDEIAKTDIRSFARRYGLPGFSSTQGHIASAVPWLPHALAAFEAGTLHRTMLMAKGSLFLGRLTRQWDGVSIVIER